MSDARAKASRQNAKASTGPKTAAGKRRSSGNARRHGFAAPLGEKGEDGERIRLLAAAFLGSTPQTDITWSLALDAARAQHTLDLISLSRLRLMSEGEENAAIYSGPWRRSDRGVIMATLSAAAAGTADIGSAPLREMLGRLRRQAPRDPLRRHAEVFQAIGGELERLDRYQLLATGRRRRAVWELDAESAGVTSVG